MTTRTILLPGPIALVPKEYILNRFGSDVPHLPDFIRDLNILSWNSGVPATVEKAGQSLAIYSETHTARLRPTQYGDAYQITSARPRTIADHSKLARNALLIQAHHKTPWLVFPELRSLPFPRLNSHWEVISAEWSRLASSIENRTTQTNLSHAQLLDDLTDIVDKTLEAELARSRESESVVYRQVEPSSDRRESRRSVYEFVLARPERARSLSPRTYVYIAGEPHLRGQIHAVRGDRVVIRFETTVNFQDIPQRGELSEQSSNRIHQVQQEAVDRVRRGTALNQRILPALIDREYRPYRPVRLSRPTNLDDYQRDVVERALGVSDFLFVLGPPGTGKTSTIKELIDELAGHGQRALLTSHTNRAVDNVLERLSPDVRAIRVGNEDSLTEAAKAFLPDNQVRHLKREIITKVEDSSVRLDAVLSENKLVRLVTRLGECVDKAETAAEMLRRCRQAQAQASEQARENWRPHLDTVEAHYATSHDAAKRAELAVLSLRQRTNRLDGRPAIIRLLMTRRAHRLRDRLGRASADLAAKNGQVDRIRSDRSTLHAWVEAQVAADPRTRALNDQSQQLQSSFDQHLSEAAAALRMIDRLLAHIPYRLEPIKTWPDWRSRVNELQELTPLLERRRELLRDWKEGVSHAGDDLQRELLKYADVVAATCIGTATSTLLSELEFDVVIVDEAGQISLPNLLVPLVRARRAILVGDHHQLPPFLDDEVKKWSERMSRTSGAPPEIADRIPNLVSKSGFEILYDGAHDEHRKMLRTQRRMPAAIGEFVSAAFYHGFLRTDHPGAGGSPIFTSPFAMISTSDRPVAQRCEEQQPDGGCRNPCEADLITDLVEHQADKYGDWAVIVPYRAQVDLIRSRMTDRLGESELIAEQIGTVDSFQGGERDLIIYGFTRSNTGGTIGFLRELRRLNVAISRAKQQLVLVGDLDMLVRAKDAEFRAMAGRMAAYLDQAGQLILSREFDQRLAALKGIP